ncbi:hypothetical protein HYC85_021506 [Camellia sinensis]|uniref:Uncharacterized protein n=1 Tax=Camellia sinensis TaxID=4442 RepID=A0A7J7GHU9_CAMSI|nr:hypothetical protein HYC85_021506 [Camellia sinensis]
MDSIVPVAVVSVVVGSLIALAVFGNYFRKRKSEVESIAQPEAIQKASKPPQSTSKKSRSKPHSHAADKVPHSFLFLGLLRFSRAISRAMEEERIG